MFLSLNERGIGHFTVSARAPDLLLLSPQLPALRGASAVPLPGAGLTPHSGGDAPSDPSSEAILAEKNEMTPCTW